MSRRLLVALFAIVAIAGLGACSDDGGGIDEETTTTAEQTTTTADDDGGDDSTDDSVDDSGDENSSGDLPDGQQPGDLGDGDGFDALADQCFEGDMAACDVLFLTTPLESNSEAYGDTCGGREDADEEAGCGADYAGDWEVPDGQSPSSITGDDSDFDDLAEECEEGDFAACDELSNDAESDSGYESYGLTCGGRLSSDALGDLQTYLGNVLDNGNEYVVCENTYGAA
jgi:hypothetical protein